MAVQTKKKAATKSVAKKTTKKVSKKVLTFNKYSVWLQAGSFLMAIFALALHVCNCISLDATLDLFAVSVLLLALSLFPNKK